MPPPEPRRPGAVPDDPHDAFPGCAGPDVAAGVDSDGDGRPDTLFETAGEDLLLHTDLDADGRADQTLRIGPDGGATEDAPRCAGPSLVETLIRLLGRPG